MPSRRTFLAALAVTAGTVGQAPLIARARTSAGQTTGGIRKSTLYSMLPKEGTYAERFAIARAAGFEAIEMGTITRDEEAAEIREASQKTGLRIHSVMNADHWRFPLSSSDPDAVAKSVRGVETSLKNAVLWGADAVLVVPAVVDAKHHLSRRLDAVADGDPRATDPAGADSQGHVGDRGGVEQVPPQPHRVRAVYRRVRVAGRARLLRRRQRRHLRLSRRTGSAHWARESSKCTSKTSTSIAPTAASRGRTSAKATSTGRKCAALYRKSATQDS